MTSSSHPSYGVVALERIGGYSTRLAGSVSGSHHTAFVLKIAPGQRSDTFGNREHWSTAGPTLIEVTFSAYQLFELLALQGTGTLVPCTLTRIGSEQVAAPPENDSGIARVIEESRERLFRGEDPSAAALKEIQDLRDEISSLKVSKAVKQALDARLSAASSALREPGVVTHVAVERMGQLLESATVQARVEARLEQQSGTQAIVEPGAVIDVPRALPGTTEDA